MKFQLVEELYPINESYFDLYPSRTKKFIEIFENCKKEIKKIPIFSNVGIVLDDAKLYDGISIDGAGWYRYKTNTVVLNILIRNCDTSDIESVVYHELSHLLQCVALTIVEEKLKSCSSEKKSLNLSDYTEEHGKIWRMCADFI